MSARVLAAALLASATSAAAQVPDRMVAYFNVDSGCTSPGADWGEAQAAHGRLALAYAPDQSSTSSASSEAPSGCTNGSPAASCLGKLLGTSFDLQGGVYQLPTHLHDYSVSVSLTKHPTDVPGWPAPERKGLVEHKSDGHSAKGHTTDATLADLAFVQFPVCVHRPKAASAEDGLPSGTISFFDTATCPDNWETFEAAHGRFIMAQQADAVGRTSTTSWISDSLLDYPEVGTHDHGISTSITVENISISSGAFSYCTAHSGTYTVSGKAKATKATDPVAPFVPLLACKKKKHPFADPAASAIPTYMIGFFDEPDCPNDRWQRLDDVAHRFLVGAPAASALTGHGGGGSAVGPDASGEMIYAHDHAVSGRIGLGTCEHHIYAVTGTTFGKYKDYSKHRSYPYSATTKTHSTAPWPYIELTACQYLGE